MSECPVCKDDLDDGYCHTCQHDLYDEPEWFLQKAADEIERLISINQSMLIMGAKSAETIERLRAKCAQRRDDLKQARDILDERFKRIERLEGALQAIARREVPDATAHGQVLVARAALKVIDDE